MTDELVSASVILDEMTKFLKKQWPRAVEIRMPYCSLIDDPLTKVSSFRVEMIYKRKPEDWFLIHAVAKLDPTTGAVTFFRDNTNWTNWI